MSGMDLPASRREVPVLEFADSMPSTNAALAERLRRHPDAADYSTLATLDQTAGRGRLDRAWSAPAGTSLAASVWIRAVDAVGRPIASERLGWLGMAAGVAATETATEEAPRGSVSLKWPNDVLIGQRKVCGVLAEAVTVDGVVHGVVVGVGMNLTIRESALPVPTATSLTLEGAEADGIVDRVLSGLLRRLRSHASALLAAGGNADHSGLRDRIRELCGTLGAPVRVELPDGVVEGTALDIDPAGRLVVRTPVGDRAFAAGDVTHLRPG